MDAEEFRKYGKEMVDFIADYWETMPQRKPMPDVQPGFMNNMVSYWTYFDYECQQI
jgi:hypothetical protein